MSYARRGYAFLGPEYASDVYVYHHTSGDFCCDDCPRLGHHFEPTALTMAVHLVDDRAAGYTVQQDTIDELIWEAENKDCPGEKTTPVSGARAK